MTRYILHIGRQKTGTSSLQHFFCANQDALARRGLYYPSAGRRSVAHHDIARYLHRRKQALLPPDEREQLRQVMANFRAEIVEQPASILLSSEAFQNCDPAWLAPEFPADSTSVVVYVREQLGYLVSAYQQAVHATNYAGSLVEYAARRLVDYDVFVDRWEAVFGPEKVDVRIYRREHLRDADIASDFLHCVGLERDDRFNLPTADRNPSIGGALLELKRALNRLSSETRTSAKLYRAFSFLAGTHPEYRRKPVLPPSLAAQLHAKVASSNRRFCERKFAGKPMLEPAEPSRHIVDVTMAEMGRALEMLQQISAAADGHATTYGIGDGELQAQESEQAALRHSLLASCDEACVRNMYTAE